MSRGKEDIQKLIVECHNHPAYLTVFNIIRTPNSATFNTWGETGALVSLSERYPADFLEIYVTNLNKR